ncbi:hypothetical protein BOTBODRAFT_499099 [Botryobasidium botryosum FD-172 SS1]|uniref:Uncharacterized protein n=1 Tax=Botryobasidium botryosum (strain FD-172 SS1) TaxID=930990 RepID=A0A067M638_BOTB1|nr:hypothetical protein BOTBODRAFT_499099 [Botryobasidium botryosum FD-172 SS1]
MRNTRRPAWMPRPPQHRPSAVANEPGPRKIKVKLEHRDSSTPSSSRYAPAKTIKCALYGSKTNQSTSTRRPQPPTEVSSEKYCLHPRAPTTASSLSPLMAISRGYWTRIRR